MREFENFNGINQPSITWYPHSGLVSYKNFLFTTRDNRNVNTLNAAVWYNSTAKVYASDEYPHAGNRGAISFLQIDISLHGNSIVVDLVKESQWKLLQKWMRTTSARLRYTRQQRALAFAMVGHGRLGAGSLAACLPNDVVDAIAKKLNAKFCLHNSDNRLE